MSKRITKLQKQIFDAHLDAFKNDTFDEATSSTRANLTVDENIAILKDLLLQGKTVKSFWTYTWDTSASITSQLMASSHLFPTGYISETAKRDTRSTMKRILNSPMLNIK